MKVGGLSIAFTFRLDPTDFFYSRSGHRHFNHNIIIRSAARGHRAQHQNILRHFFATQNPLISQSNIRREATIVDTEK